MTDYLASSRPTAVNLFWALDRMRAAADRHRGEDPLALVERLLSEARAIHEEDCLLCRAMGRFGAALVADGASLLTHCNAGGLATADYGTALAVFFAAHDSGKKIHVYADETRPLLQGARLTAWELSRRGIPVTVQCDSAAAMLMWQGKSTRSLSAPTVSPPTAIRRTRSGPIRPPSARGTIGCRSMWSPRRRPST